ncbi:EXO1 [[Candida] subhashii]|uniref:EXO1 n=1 Tax=[Candida] subhashii TaxID=561895 RepID=A0A8J5Q4J7_9ASCO|nr:EXO1 [[Candida] subhashii]KAG7661529.1 EXO1 [[Candida] subhashii]
MGVTGLLPALKEIQEPGTLERYRGKTLAIDTYGWLHRGLISCAQELCSGQPTRKYITSIINKVQMLRHFGVEPYFVFDGASLPTKEQTALERRTKREEARTKAEEYTRLNKSKLAFKEYMKAAYVTSQMAKSIMVELDELNIKYIVAPYEADPQMVYLEKIGLVDGILSEDSDLLIFGCKRLITKLKDDGTCVEINRENFGKVRQIPYLSTYTQEQLRLVAMLSGCDYTKGVAGIGMKGAFTYVRKYNNLEKVLIALRADGKKIPAEFREEVQKANLAFQFQKVFNPEVQELRTLNEYPEHLDVEFEVLESCCGKTLNNEIYRQICNGEIDPNRHEILVSREQSLNCLKSPSVNLGRTISISNKIETKKRSILELLKVSNKSTSTTLKISNSESTTTTTISMKSESQKTPERQFKKPKIQTTTDKLSPTSRKVKRIIMTPSPSRAQKSKFFSPPDEVDTNVPVKDISYPSPDISIATTPKGPIHGSIDAFSSFLEDSEIPEGSSPIKTTDGKGFRTDNILDELSGIRENEYYEEDDDGVEDSLKEGEAEEKTPIKKKDTTSRDDGFDIDEHEDEIEESPIKTNQFIQEFKSALRDAFSCDSTGRSSNFKEMFSKKSNKVILGPNNTTTSGKKSQRRSLHVVEKLQVSNSENVSSAISTVESSRKLSQTVDLKQFAYRRR